MAAPNGFVWGDAENQKILSAAKRANEAFGGVPAQISHTPMYGTRKQSAVRPKPEVELCTPSPNRSEPNLDRQ
jgi:hypothetical protein